MTPSSGHWRRPVIRTPHAPREEGVRRSATRTVIVFLMAFAAAPLCRGQPPAISPPADLAAPQPAIAARLPEVLSAEPAPPQTALSPALPQPSLPQPAWPIAPAPVPSDGIVLELLPFGVLWEPPIANQREPRCYAKFTNLHGQGTIDTAIGADFGLARLGPAAHKDEGFEIDVFAAVFTRFEAGGDLTCMDYRVGCPLTFATHDWQFKLGYEHTSTHISDGTVENLINEGLYSGLVTPPRKFMRDEIVAGVARRFGEQVRVYGQMGCSFSNNADLPNDVWRYDWGVEWTPPRHSPHQSGPYAAFDMDLRDEQDYVPNVTLQAGWQWRVGRGRDSAGRLGVEYYDGRSPFGAFLEEHETWWAFIASYDW